MRKLFLNWASNLDTALSVTWNAGVSVTWTDPSWRLPATVNGPYDWGYDGTTTAGYNITSSEMGHLYYEELENLGYYDTSGNEQLDYGLKNTGDFNNLIASWYWSGTEYANTPSFAWDFSMGNGTLIINNNSNVEYGLAVRSGQVSSVPVPGAIILLGAGLLWVAGIGRKSRRDV